MKAFRVLLSEATKMLALGKEQVVSFQTAVSQISHSSPDARCHACPTNPQAHSANSVLPKAFFTLWRRKRYRASGYRFLGKPHKNLLLEEVCGRKNIKM